MLSSSLRVLLTGIVVLIAAGVVAYKYWDYLVNPWTRDGQVQALVIQVTPRVSAPIINLPIVDNQFVNAGDLLFEIDPRTFAAALDQARADLDRTRDDIESLKSQVEAAKAAVVQYASLIDQQQSTIDANVANLADARANFERMSQAAKSGAVSRQALDNAKANFDIATAQLTGEQAQLIESRAQLAEAQARLTEAQAELGAPGEDNARLRAAKATVRSAELDLEFTRVTAPVDGYVTNLNLRLGSQAVENEPALALVDVNSYWVYGFFKENWIADMRPGDRAIVTLMTYPDRPLEGRVDSLGWGISQDDGSTGYDLLPDIDATFEWIRLAQRVPVRVHLVDVPEDIKLRVGTTSSVLVMTGTSGDAGANSVPAAPRPLQ